jgi:hypothetical protein
MIVVMMARVENVVDAAPDVTPGGSDGVTAFSPHVGDRMAGGAPGFGDVVSGSSHSMVDGVGGVGQRWRHEERGGDARKGQGQD